MSRCRRERDRSRAKDELSFPVPYADQAKYLKLACDFLRSEEPSQKGGGNVIKIDRDRLFPLKSSKKIA